MPWAISRLENPSCFISYSRDDIGHEKWVREFATKLVKNGVETALDQWDSYPGMDLTRYQETSIRESDFVLMVCTPTYKEKADAGRGGVGYEKMIITGEIFEEIASPKKFVPILRSGTPKNSLPSFFKSKVYVDFREDDKFDSQVTFLLRHIYETPKHKKPPLGSKRSFDEDSSPAQPTPKNPVKVPQATISLQKFKEVYTYASALLGMNLRTEEAKAFATQWMERFFDKDFERFKEAYRYALGLLGMNLNNIDAISFALKRVSQE